MSDYDAVIRRQPTLSSAFRSSVGPSRGQWFKTPYEKVTSIKGRRRISGGEGTFYEERHLVARNRASPDSDVKWCVSPKVPGWTVLQPRQPKRDAPSSSFCLHGGHRCPKLSIPSRGCWRALRWVPHLLHAKCSNLHELF
ncbi:hypothetical protein ACOMHN_045359 [Nucella lapillus]